MKIFECSTKEGDIASRRVLVETGYPDSLATLLAARGICSALDAERFLQPSFDELHDPYDLPDMGAAVERIRAAIAARESICIFGDYDTDGICATSMLTLFLGYMGASCFYHIPSRHDDGYGISKRALDKISSLGAKLIVTVDNGITANEEIEYAKTLGMDVVVTDHHRCFNALPECDAVVCTTRDDCKYENKNLCGAGVALKLIEALASREAAKAYLPYAALATVADVMPLCGENRAIVALAIKAMQCGETPVGMEALINTSKCIPEKVNSRDLAFSLSPRINAAGRMASASIAVELMLSDDMEYALSLALRLNEFNDARKADEAAIIADVRARLEACDMSRRAIIIEGSPDYNSGIIGIAAARVSDRFYRPAILFSISNGIATGSARSIPGIDIQSVLSKFSDRFIRFGGHELAAGLTIRADMLDEFAADINEYLLKTAERRTYIKRAYYEAQIELKDVTGELVANIERLAPFGDGNEQPVFLAHGVRLTSLKRVGADGAHLKLQLVSKSGAFLDAIAFHRGADFQTIADMDMADILFTPSINEFNGRRSLSLRLIEINPAIPDDPAEYVRTRREKFCESFGFNLAHMYDCDGASFEAVNFDDIEKDDLSGTLILCFGMRGAVDFFERMKQNVLPYDISFFEPCVPPGENAVVIAPKLDARWIKNYKKIICYDTPYAAGYITALSAGGAQIILAKNSFVPDYDIASAFVLPREHMKKHYRALLNKCRRAEFADRAAQFTASYLDVPVYESHFAMEVFLELGFFGLDRNMRIFANEAPISRDLCESAIYINACHAEQSFRAMLARCAVEDGQVK